MAAFRDEPGTRTPALVCWTSHHPGPVARQLSQEPPPPTVGAAPTAPREEPAIAASTASDPGDGHAPDPAPADGSVTVRLVRQHEIPAVAALTVAAYTNDYEISDGYRAQLADVAPRAHEHQVWVAVDAADGALLGTVTTPRPGGSLSELAQDGELDFRLLGVSPQARGRGIGTLLTAHVVAIARARGARRVVMNSGPQMRPAHLLYEHLGFVRLRERETHLVEGHPLLAFGLDLDPALDPALDAVLEPDPTAPTGPGADLARPEG